MSKKIKINKPGNSKLWFIISDLHFPEQDQEAVEVMLAAHRELNPDYTLLLGDVLDCGLFSMHPKRYFIENSAYDFHQLEINPANTMIDQLQKNTKLHTYFLEGNHESIQEDTEILAHSGWIKASNLTLEDDIASYNLNTKEISFAKPVALSKHNAPLFSIEGDLHNEIVSDRHKLVIDNKLQLVSEGKIKSNRFTYAGKRNQPGVNIPLDILRVLTWTIMDATLVFGPGIKTRIQWKLSKPRKIQRIQELLSAAGIKFTYRPATKSPSNKLQPYYICIYGEDARKLTSLLPEGKRIQSNWKNLSKEELEAVLFEIKNTDGTFSINNHIEWRSTCLSDIETIQLACIFNEIPCYYRVSGKSGFIENGKTQYVAIMFDKGVSNKRNVTIKNLHTEGPVVSIQSKDGTIITRRNGKVAFTGNSRIERWSVANGRIGESIYDLISPRSTIAKHRENFTMIPYSPLTGDRRGFVQISKPTIKRPGLVAVHGWSVAKHAASAHLEKSRSQSVIHGHTHRQQLETSRDPWTGQIIKAFCPGTLSKLQPIYMVGGAPSSWSHGVCIVYVGNESWTEYLISIVNGRCVLPTGKEIRLV